MSQKPREIAIRLLAREITGPHIEDLMERELDLNRIIGPDRRLVQEIVYGIIRWHRTLDWLIGKKTEGKEQKSFISSLLKMGLYQMFWLDRIPDHAAVNESVQLARELGFGPQSGFINAVLRDFARDKEATKKMLADLKIAEPALGHSHPDWLFNRWETRWGKEDTLRLMEWNNQPAKTFARVNTLRNSAEALIELWRKDNVEYDFVARDWIDDNLIFELKAYPPLARVPSFQAGGFYVQDPSTLMAVTMLDPQPGEAIMDFCAAPGGKTSFMAQLMENRGRLRAVDRDPKRLTMLEENLTRLGVTCASIASLDELPIPQNLPAFDRILVDAPCSNTGVMRRRIELRWRLKPEEITRLTLEQSRLLTRAAGYVKKGGMLVYSTCSIEFEENEGVVEGFLKNNPNWILEDQRQLLPFKENVDGAYAAVLIRKT